MINVKYHVQKQKLDKKVQSFNSAVNRSLEHIGQAEVFAAKNRIVVSKMSPDNQPWAPWAISTLRSRIRQGNAHLGILYRTGELLRSIYYKVTNLRLEVGSKAFYAKYLQEGTPNMPARPFLGFTQQTINKLKSLFKTELDK